MNSNDFQNEKYIALIGNSNEFLVRGVIPILHYDGYTTYFIDSNTDIIPPVPDYISKCILFADGTAASKYAIPLKETCSLRNLSICLVGDRIGLEEALNILPKENVKHILNRPIGANVICKTVEKMFKDSSLKNRGEILLLIEDNRFAEGFLKHFGDIYKIHMTSDMNNAEKIIMSDKIYGIVAEADMLEQDDYINFNSLCMYNPFRKLPLVMILDKEDVVTKAKAELMQPDAIISKLMPVEQISEVLAKIQLIDTNTTDKRQRIVIKGTEKQSAQGSILGELTKQFAIKW